MTKERRDEIFNSLISAQRLGDLFVLARYQYRIGDDLLDNECYDFLETTLKELSVNEVEEYLHRTYDDDPVPYALLIEFGLEVADVGVREERMELATLFNEDKSLSISSVTSMEEAYEFYSYYRDMRQNLSHALKVDGDNTKNLYLDDSFKLSLSRGRDDANSFDFTDNIMQCLPTKISGVPSEFRLFAEAYVESNYLPILRKKYPRKDFVTEKSAALSLLRVKADPTDYLHLKVLAFSGEGLASTVTETYTKLKQLGFTTPPQLLIKWEEIPNNLTQFTEWLEEKVFNFFVQFKETIPSDGIVVEVDDYNYTGTINGQYSTRQLALKFGPWKFQHEKGIVTSIIMEQRRVKACMKVTIEPIKTYDGSRAKVINCFNPNILIKTDLFEGQTVYFERNSGAVNILIHGQRLDELKLLEVSDNENGTDDSDFEDEE